VTLLAALYFLAFGMLGVYAPWLPPYLAEKGLSPGAIGVALAVVSTCRVVFPPAWGVLADHTRHKRALLAGTAAIAGAALVALSWFVSPVLLILILLVHGFFLTPVVPLLEAATLGALGQARGLYGRVRLWGSIGFIVTSVTTGVVVSRLGVSSVALLAGLPLVAFGLVAWRVRLPAEPVSSHEYVPLRSLPWRALAPILIASVLGQASHGPYYAFFSLQLLERGVSSVTTGALWAIGVIAETALMAYSPRLFARVGHITAIRWAMILSALRWALFASTGSLVLIGLGQILHAASYALYHLAAVQWVDSLMPPSRRALGQSILSACAYGLGVGGGLALAGIFAKPLGASGLYAAAAVACVLGYVVVRFWMPRATRA